MLRDPLDFLRDIEESCIRIIDYSAGLGRDEVFADTMRLDGILHNFHVIGEAVKKLPNDLREGHSDIPWAEIAGMRDFIAHAYFSLDLAILWQGIQQDVPVLLERVQHMIASLREEHSS
jgi:uncharacterized protein with HEPN domain